MARPPSRSRRTREEEPPARRGRPAPRKAAGPPMGIIVGSAVVVIGAGIAAMVVSSKKPAPPKEPPRALAPVVTAPEPEAPRAPVKVPPPPLTEKEKAFVNGLFEQAEPHMKLFYEFAAEGWKLEDEAARNEVWVKAKKEAHKAIGIVSEAMEDYDLFPSDRQEAHMRSWNGRLSQWQSDLQNKIGKTH